MGNGEFGEPPMPADEFTTYANRDNITISLWIQRVHPAPAFVNPSTNMLAIHHPSAICLHRLCFNLLWFNYKDDTSTSSKNAMYVYCLTHSYEHLHNSAGPMTAWTLYYYLTVTDFEVVYTFVSVTSVSWLCRKIVPLLF